MSKNFILPFAKLTKKSIKEAGGKGASLGEMTRAKFPVPPGFVVGAGAFEKYLEKTDINVEIDAALDKVNPKDTESVEEASEVLRSLIKKMPMEKSLQKEILSAFKKLKTKFVAVRSSATAEDSKIDSWAGELESYLNVQERNLINAVQNCWASLFTPRAIFYRLERGLGGKKVLVAVVIQKMVESEVAGVAFSVHPVTRDRNQMVIEAGWGLGEAIVAGKITPDTYVIDKKDMTLLDINVSEQEKMIVQKKTGEGNLFVNVPKAKKSTQKLAGDKILQLAKIVKNIEKHYNMPQDIEWAYEKGKFYIVQARPITTL
ncbi:MAG: PEP/pyruvate-binding domain-containing protein [Patescibacteria group bacterium]